MSNLFSAFVKNFSSAFESLVGKSHYNPTVHIQNPNTRIVKTCGECRYLYTTEYGDVCGNPEMYITHYNLITTKTPACSAFDL